MTESTDLGWLAGAWHGPVWGGHMEEHWTEPSGGCLLGMNRVVAEGKAIHREFLTIETSGQTTIMSVFIVRGTDGPIEAVTFTLSEARENHAVFMNPDHDRLSQVAYTRTGFKMVIQLEGRRKDQPFSDLIELRCD